MNFEKNIQLYLDGSLKGADLEVFRKKLKEDDVFRALFMDYQKAWDLIENQHRKMSKLTRLNERLGMSRNAISPEEIKAELDMLLHIKPDNPISEEKFKELLEVYLRKKSRKTRRIGFILALAAGILLLIGIPLTFFTKHNIKNSAQLYEIYYSPYPYLLHERSLTNAQTALNAKAMYLYNNHDYLGASIILNEQIHDSLTNPLQRLYLGICYMELKQYDEAIKTFEGVISLHQYLTFDQANWYMALTYLKMNRRLKATEYLQRVKSDSCLFSKQAIEILNKIKER
jgi:tetratricopeptide (TPR) repeat protein